MNNDRFLIYYDTETGGTDPRKHSLLTAFFAIVDSNYNIVGELDLQVKPDDIKQLFYEQEALDVNKIKISEHLKSPDTITYSEARVRLIDFFNEHKVKNRRKWLIPAGHNIVKFDDRFLFNSILPEEDYEKYLYHIPYDTLIIAGNLRRIGLLPEDVGSLGSLIEHYSLAKDEAHTARGDVLMNINVGKALENTLRVAATDNAKNSNSLSLLEIVEG